MKHLIQIDGDDEMQLMCASYPKHYRNIPYTGMEVSFLQRKREAVVLVEKTDPLRKP